MIPLTEMIVAESGYSLACPFWIDTDAYSERDQWMFVAGFEFAEVLGRIRSVPGRTTMVVHRENESRIRMACGRFGRRCRMEYFEADEDPAGEWVRLVIEPK